MFSVFEVPWKAATVNWHFTDLSITAPLQQVRGRHQCQDDDDSSQQLISESHAWCHTVREIQGIMNLCEWYFIEQDSEEFLL